MIKSIKDLSFNKSMEEHIKNVEECFNEIAKTEHHKGNMLDWINKNLEEIKLDGLLEGLTKREQFLFAFTMLSSEIEQWING